MDGSPEGNYFLLETGHIHLVDPYPEDAGDERTAAHDPPGRRDIKDLLRVTFG